MIACPTPPVRLLALVPYAPGSAPSQRFRIEQWLPLLREQEIRVDLLPFVDGQLARTLHRPGALAQKALGGCAALTRRVCELLRVRRYDTVLIHRAASIVGPAWVERFLALSGRPVIYDFDDAIWMLHTSRANRLFGWLKFPGKTAAICRLATHVVTGNSYLADYARQFNPEVTVIPSSVETDRFQPNGRREPGEKVVVGWTGSSTSQAYLELFGAVLRELAKRRPVEIRVHSDRPPELPGVPVTWRPWSPDNEAEEIGAFDVGIMPMPDNPWSRGKCAMKALLYMAMEVPTIASPVGMNADLIRHGENGLLAATPGEWVAGLERLVDDAGLRRKLGRAGRQTVLAGYSAEVCAARFADVVRRVVAAKGRK